MISHVLCFAGYRSYHGFRQPQLPFECFTTQLFAFGLRKEVVADEGACGAWIGGRSER